MDQPVKEAMQYAFSEKYGHINPELLPIMPPLWKEAFLKGVQFGKDKPIELWDEEEE